MNADDQVEVRLAIFTSESASYCVPSYAVVVYFPDLKKVFRNVLIGSDDDHVAQG
jgi:hypothetical protein